MTEMTIEQAIFILHPDTHVDSMIKMKGDWPQQYEEARALACKAMEKQIVKKPVHKKFRSIEYPQCPVCNRVLFASEKYCATCGQAIDRGE